MPGQWTERPLGGGEGLAAAVSPAQHPQPLHSQTAAREKEHPARVATPRSQLPAVLPRLSPWLCCTVAGPLQPRPRSSSPEKRGPAQRASGAGGGSCHSAGALYDGKMFTSALPGTRQDLVLDAV